MSTNAHMIEDDGPQIETSEILGFLIKRFSEALTSDDPKVPFLLQGLGVVVLGRDEELTFQLQGRFVFTSSSATRGNPPQH